MSELSVVVVQPNLKWEDKGFNLKLLESLVDRHTEKIDVLVLPEMFSTGFTMNPVSLAESTSGTTVEWMNMMADQRDCLVTGSLIIEEDNHFSNRFLAVSSAGIIAKYDKRHLFRMGDEENHYKAGDQRVVFEWRGWRLLPQICYDLRFPVWMRNQDDYDLILLVASWPKPRGRVWNNLLTARALENQSFVVASNRVGIDNNGIDHAGDSQVIDPKGQTITDLGDEEGVLHASLSLQSLLDFRTKFPAHLDRDHFQIIS